MSLFIIKSKPCASKFLPSLPAADLDILTSISVLVTLKENSSSRREDVASERMSELVRSRTIEHHYNGRLPVLDMCQIRIELLVFLDQVRDVLAILVLVDPVNAHNRRIWPFGLQ
jgi:hypothetical protein